jgi:hypothetical protein
MVIKALDTVVASGAVDSARRSVYAAGVAEAQADQEPVDDLLLLFTYSMARSLWIGRTPRYDTGVAARGRPKRGYCDEVNEDAKNRNGGGQGVQRLRSGAKKQHRRKAHKSKCGEAIVDLWAHHEAAVAKEPV